MEITLIVVVRDVNAAIRLLFPGSEDQVRRHLEPLASDRVRWAVLALSYGDPERFEHYLRDGLRDYRDVLMGAESCSPELKGPIVRALPASEELAFRFLRQELEGLGFFDRLVQSGALTFDPPQDPAAVVFALTKRLACGFDTSPWREVPMDTARFLLLHVMKRSFTEAEMARAPNLLEEFVSVAPVKRSFVSNLPEELPIESDGRPHRGSRPLNYKVGVVLLGQARAWGLWMVHAAG
jgi:hypothetical protein